MWVQRKLAERAREKEREGERERERQTESKRELERDRQIAKGIIGPGLKVNTVLIFGYRFIYSCNMICWVFK